MNFAADLTSCACEPAPAGGAAATQQGRPVIPDGTFLGILDMFIEGAGPAAGSPPEPPPQLQQPPPAEPAPSPERPQTAPEAPSQPPAQPSPDAPSQQAPERPQDRQAEPRSQDEPPGEATAGERSEGRAERAAAEPEPAASAAVETALAAVETEAEGEATAARNVEERPAHEPLEPPAQAKGRAVPQDAAEADAPEEKGGPLPRASERAFETPGRSGEVLAALRERLPDRPAREERPASERPAGREAGERRPVAPPQEAPPRQAPAPVPGGAPKQGQRAESQPAEAKPDVSKEALGQANEARMVSAIEGRATEPRPAEDGAKDRPRGPADVAARPAALRAGGDRTPAPPSGANEAPGWRQYAQEAGAAAAPVRRAPVQAAGQARAAIVQQAQYASRNGRSEVTLRLHPPELGRMKLDIEMVEGKLDVRIRVENVEVREALRAELGNLDRSLREAALDPGRLEVADYQTGRRDGRAGYGPQTEREPDGGEWSPLSAAAEQARYRTWTVFSESGGVDCLV